MRYHEEHQFYTVLICLEIGQDRNLGQMIELRRINERLAQMIFYVLTKRAIPFLCMATAVIFGGLALHLTRNASGTRQHINGAAIGTKHAPFYVARGLTNLPAPLGLRGPCRWCW